VIAETAARPAISETRIAPSVWADAAWAIAVLALVVLTVASALRAGTDAAPRVAVWLGAAGVLVAARLVSPAGRRVVVAIVVVIAAILLLRAPGSVLNAAPRSGPFGYSSITGAFFAQAAIAGLMLATSRSLAIRLAGIVSAAAFGWVTVATDTRTSAVLLVVLAIGAVVVYAMGHGRFAIVTLGCIVALAIVTTAVVGAAYSPDGSTVLARVVDPTVTEHRQALWHDALTLAARHPLLGAGPGRFATASPVARSDADAPWAHQEFLQVAAEIGVPAALLLVALFGLGFARLASRHPIDVLAVLAAAALAVLGVHACVEYVLQRPAVPLAAAALVGAGIGPFGWMERRHARHAGA
jgi:O-Antigen ligase